MPKLKQPPRLLTVATDVLIYTLVKYCDECSTAGSLDKLRQHITFVKEDIGPYIPWQLHADFYEKFLEKFLYGCGPLMEPPVSYRQAVFEVIMDKKIFGLKCLVHKLSDIKDAHRIQGLQELRLYAPCHNLESFQLGDLRVLEFYEFCTDSHLQIIGKHCSKLEFLKIDLTEITNAGLLALSSCSELRHLLIYSLGKLTYEGFRDFLSAHKGIQRLHARIVEYGAPFDSFANVGWSVYPSVNELAIEMKRIDNRDLRCIIESFPNLISLEIAGYIDSSVDWTTLASLHKLSILYLSTHGEFSWEDLKPLLKLIGPNITSLKTNCYSPAQNNLDFLNNSCPNIEYLRYTHLAITDGEIAVVIPPFKRLKQLDIHVVYGGDVPVMSMGLQLGVMPKLEKLKLVAFLVTTKILESMILDNARFPNLSSLQVPLASYKCIDRIRKIVKKNNLDLQIRK